MSIITIGARHYLDRLAWGNPAAGQLANLNADQLRALLQMAQNEGQSEVEQWVRDAMSSRGIYANRRVAKQYTSVMNASDWLSKALALILAGGILVGGPTLPVVDQIAGGGGYRQPAVVQEYDQYQEYIDHLIKIAPAHRSCIESSNLTIQEGNTQGHGGMYQHDSGTITIKPGHPDPYLIIGHELAHWMDYNCGFGDSHGQEFVDIVQETSRATIADTYGDPNTPYNDRPKEVFANIFAQIYADRSGGFQEARGFVNDWLTGRISH